MQNPNINNKNKLRIRCSAFYDVFDILFPKIVVIFHAGSLHSGKAKIPRDAEI